ncbi:MAG: TonB-dependent receptor [Acidobacteria bacterium]|nr:TonB-dependent receptor [Acidobacteriota bacterium]
MKKLFVFCALLLLAAVFPLPAQDATGRVVGTVTDPSGALLPDTKITVTNTATGVSRETLTDSEGNFQVLSVPIGAYQVTAEHTGFTKVVTETQALQINQSLRFDIHMKVGAVTETVQVEALTSTVETMVAMLGQSVTARPLHDLPLNGRNMLDLALLQPGVTEQRPNGGPGGFSFSIAGGRTDSVTYLLDGGMNNNLLNNGPVYTPNPDAVAEFRLLTSNYTAEYGRNGAGIISIVTRSGTNDWHGGAHDFVRNDAFNANPFFNNANKIPKPILKRNQFGASIGGPIDIPRVLHGKDRFFFFTSYQGQRLVQTSVPADVTTFTPAELNGDFSRSNRGNPDTGVANFLTKFPFFQPNPNLAGQAIIDPSRFNSVAKAYLKNNLIPTSPSGRLSPRGGGKQDNDELTNKLDFLLTQSDRLSVTLGARRAPSLNPFDGANVSGYATTSSSHRYFGNIAYTKVFSPNLLNDLRFTAQRNNGLQASPAIDLPKAADLGIGITPDHPTGPPRVSFNSGLTIGFSPQGPTNLIDNTYVWSDTLSWTKGRHTWKFGFMFSPYQNNTVYDFYVNGNFYFSGASGNGGIGSGNDRADFLLGLPDELLQFGEAPSDIRTKSYNFFAQDEWRVARNLVLTFGLRYDYSSPKIDTRGRSFSLKLGQQSQVFTKAPVGLLFPGDPGAPQGANFPDKNDWAPRFGFVWDPLGKGKTSIRGGFGVFYDILKGEDNLQFNGQAPFFGFADLFFDPLEANPTREVNYMTQPFIAADIPNSFPSRPPAKDLNFGNAGFLPFGGGGVYFVDPHLRTPYIYQYNLSIQQELVRNLNTELSYVGSSSHKLTSLTDTNPFVRGTSNRVFATQPGATASSFSYLDTFMNLSSANYHSLQASLTKRLSENRFFGTSYFTLAYTYGHSIDNASGFREGATNSRVPYYNWRQFYASSAEDIRQRIVFSGGWDLPFDRVSKSAPGRLTKGWSLYPIVTYRTGFPYDVLSNISRSRTRPGPSGAGDPNLVRANLVGSSVGIYDPHQVQTFNGRAGNYYFNPASFAGVPLTGPGLDYVANPSQRTYGTLGRNILRAPGRTNFDIALAKSTNLVRERAKVDFRAEFFNLFNHAQFREPNSTITSGTFGQISQTYDPRIIQLALRFTF